MQQMLKALEARMQIMESNQDKVQELIDLLEDVKSALRLFVKIGNAFKWLAIVIASLAAAWAAIRK